ncbi:MAG: HAD family hydrolase [bacterium]
MKISQLLKTKKAVIFDLFHTLISFDDSGRPWTSEVLGIEHEIWSRQLVENSPDRLLGKIKEPYELLETSVHAIDPAFPEDIIRKATENRLLGMRDVIVNIDRNIIHTLQSIKDNGKKIGLISNADYLEIDSWADSPLAPIFDSTIFSCEVGLVKPQPEIYKLCLNELEVSPEDSVFVGDGGSDELLGAREIGMTTVMMTGIIKRLWPDLIVKRKDQADYIIESLTELI